MRSLPPHLASMAFAATLLALCGCADAANTRAIFQNATINGQPAHFLLDTGSTITTLSNSAAHRLGLQFTPPPRLSRAEMARDPGRIAVGLSESARLSVGAQSITAQFPVTSGADLGDGLIGWPEVQDNILVFDPAARTIRAAENLPPQTAGWLKLKIHHDLVLLLETPLSPDHTGIILVDTGAPYGIALPPAQWKQWRAAHPKAPAVTRQYIGPSVGAGRRVEAWADKITLGNITLNDVPVHEALPFEVSWIQNYAGTIGLYALSRMDFVVDGAHDMAYLAPKEPPGPYYPGINRLGIQPNPQVLADDHWSVQENLLLNGDQALLFSSHTKWQANDRAGAIADLDLVLKNSPRNLDACLTRGGDKLAIDDYPGAIADFTLALQLDPTQDSACISRGIARQCQGDYAGALGDYDHGMATAPRDGLPLLRICQESLHLRLGKVSADFAQNLAAWPHEWPQSLGRFLAGQIDDKILLAAAQKGAADAQRSQKCSAFYYIGFMHPPTPDHFEARRSWEQALATGAKNDVEYKFAQAELARLKPTAP